MARNYAGAQGGVDQAGYLITPRLLAGEKNVYSAWRPAEVATQPAQQPTTAAATQAAGVPSAFADHPPPSRIQIMPLFDGIRNRLSFVPETPFQFVSRMCIMTEPFGPPTHDKPAEYRVYAKSPFGYPLMAAI